MRKVVLTLKEENKYKVIKKLVETNGNKQRAANKLNITIRQVNRLIAGYKKCGKEFFVHGNRGRKPKHALTTEFKDYIENNFSDFMPAHAATSATSDFSIRFSRWCGHVGKPDFYSPINITGVEKQFVEKSYVTEFGRTGKRFQYMIISLNSEEERWNFVNYWKSKVVRFILSFYKCNISLLDGNTWRAVPWMDFTQEWNDKKLCEEFGISEELWNYIDNFIPDYYSDYKSGF
jgi:hypothetical protein